MRPIAVCTTPFLLLGLLAGCATNVVNEADPHAPLHESRPAPKAEAEAPDPRGGKAETVRSKGKPDWAPVFETPPGTRYGDQTVIYVDRNSLTEHKLDKLTYYQAITREVRSASSGARIQELAVLCEGAPIAPATSLRGEGSENRDGSYRIKRAPTPLTSLSQFSTHRIPIDPKVPSTFVVRAICLLGTDPHR
ncbi:MAG: hypothetical protein Q4D91_08840 [Lautropia sp.]|nr:hypothetical protein [Lautropia sp.]